MVEFLDAIKSPVTRRQYLKRLEHFFHDINIEGPTLQAQAKVFIEKARADNQWATSVVLDFIRFQKERVERGEIVGGTVENLYKPVKLLLQENDIVLNWKKIARRIPSSRSFSQDRLPTVEEIKAIISAGDRRLKPAVLIMVSAGIRVGAFEFLNWGDVTPIKSGDELVAAKVIVYRGEQDEYFTFCSPETYRALKDYVDFRVQFGEVVTDSSPLIRDIWWGDRLGKTGHEVKRPQRTKVGGVKRLVEDAIRTAGIRPAGVKKKRWEFQGCHGFRKFFKTQCEGKMKTLHVELLMGHMTGLNANYYRPKEADLLEDYLKAVPDLTLFERPAKESSVDIEELKKQVRELKDWKSFQEARTKKLMEMPQEDYDSMVDFFQEWRANRQKELDHEAAEQFAEDNEQFRRSLKSKARA